MLQFLQLTLQNNGKPVLVNIDNVFAIFAPIESQAGGAVVCMSGCEGEGIHVKQDVGQIALRIREVVSFMSMADPSLPPVATG